ncbi:GMC oxidoreductase [Streptomyces mirabilis]|uniref:GMC oxidoreductase n=1 Tax=Streptomyces mirabilis TaxID=68239 RepID=UPI00367DD9B6
MASAEAAPLVDPNILGEWYDLEALVDAVERCREIAGALGPEAWTCDDLQKYVRRAVGATTGPAPAGSQDSPVVVGPELRVHGVQGLLIADTAIVPSVHPANTDAPSAVVGEKASALIITASS